MPQVSDPRLIRAILQRDPLWSVYALGDLEPGFFEHTRWWVSTGREPALLLLYRRFGRPVLFTLGPSNAVAALLSEIDGEPEMHLHVRPEIVDLVERTHAVSQRQEMVRMVLDTNRFAASVSDADRLNEDDVIALEQLYADGIATGEAPDFFAPEMVTRGVYFGVREGSALVAAGGTHIVSGTSGVGAVGNVYTRRDRRGRGLGARVIGAVTAALLGMRVQTIALNVKRENAVAIRLYERLGFDPYCTFCEGIAVRKAG